MVFGLCTRSFGFQQVNTLKANCQWLKNVRGIICLALATDLRVLFEPFRKPLWFNYKNPTFDLITP